MSSSGIWPISVSHLPGFGQSRSVIFRDLANLGKSSSGIWSISVCHFRDLANLCKSFSGIRPILNLTFGEKPVSHFYWTKATQKSLRPCKWFYAPLMRLNHYKEEKNLPGLQFIILDRMSLVMHPNLFELTEQYRKRKNRCPQARRITVNTVNKVNK